MKKQLLAVLVLFMVAACSTTDEDSQIDPTVLGTWTNSQLITAEDVEHDLEEGEYIFNHQIKFSADNTFTEFAFLANRETEEIIGYLAKNEGTYSVNENRLKLNFDRWYSNEDFTTRFVPVEDLVIIHEDQEESFNYSFSNNRNKLIFNFDPCAPNEFCVGEMEYFREE